MGFHKLRLHYSRKNSNRGGRLKTYSYNSYNSNSDFYKTKLSFTNGKFCKIVLHSLRTLKPKIKTHMIFLDHPWKLRFIFNWSQEFPQEYFFNTSGNSMFLSPTAWIFLEELVVQHKTHDSDNKILAGLKQELYRAKFNWISRKKQCPGTDILLVIFSACENCCYLIWIECNMTNHCQINTKKQLQGQLKTSVILLCDRMKNISSNFFRTNIIDL